MDTPDLHRLVRQHARTSQLLGVDFVPAYRAAGGEVPSSIESDVAPLAVPTALPQAAEVVVVTPKAPDAPAPVRPASVRQVPAHPRAAPAVVALPTLGGSALGPKDRVTNETAMTALRAKYEVAAPHAAFDTTFTNIVWGDGDVAARLCFVGEAPGEDEDLQGKPFVGRSGQLLDKMIVAMGLSRAEVYICNVLKTRPPGNRTPTADEVEACKPYLLEQLAIVRPEAIVGLGLSACGALLGPGGGAGEPMSRLRGRWWEIEDSRGVKIPFMPTYHPAFLLRSYSDENRAKVWSDLKMVMDRLGLVGKKQIG